MRLKVVLILAVVLMAGCGDSGDKEKGDALMPDADGYVGPDGATGKDGRGPGRNQSPAFSYNGEICKIGPTPQSAVTGKLEVSNEMLDFFAARLEEEGFEIYRGPEEPIDPSSGELEDVVSPVADIGARDVSYWDTGAPDPSDLTTTDGFVSDLPGLEDVIEEPVWTGGQYVIARTPLSDLIYVLESGVIGVASWCPAHSLGQIRRLDYTLADAIRIWGQSAGYDYTKETKGWAMPVSYYTTVAGTYQRSYMNDSLDMNEPHSGQLSISGLPLMTGFALYGHADSPSQVGDVVGVDMLQIGQTVIAENDTVTVSGQVVRLWDITQLAGEGENPIIVDPFVSDASINWQVGVYYFFADAIFPESVHGSFVLNLQGSPPGKLLLSKTTDGLVVPPTAPLF